MQVTIVTHGIEELEKEFGLIDKKAMKVLNRVLKRVFSNVRKNISIEVKNRYKNIKSDTIKNTLKLKEATSYKPEASISSIGYRLPVYKLFVTPKSVIKLKGIKAGPDKTYKRRKTYKAQVLKHGSPKLIRHAFVQKMENGHLGLFKRASVDGGTIKFSKLHAPIKEVYGPSIPEFIGNDEVLKSITKKAEEVYNERIKHELNRVLGRL